MKLTSKTLFTIESTGYQGLRIPELDITLDGNGNEGDYLFVSHAHGDHTPGSPASKALYATPPTCELMKARGGPDAFTAVDFHTTIDLKHANVTFYPAGHILGSAMIYIESDESKILYSGDYRTPAAAATDGFSCPDDVDIFITEATFGLPIYRWKSHEVLFRQIRNFARQTLDANETPLFLAYNLGKAQELMQILASLNEIVQIHGGGFKLCSIYENHGIDLGTYEKYERESAEGKILIAPVSAYSNNFASHINDLKIAYCSGWASLESRRTQLTVDQLIPLSDHLDFFELLGLCKRLDPDQVYLTHSPDPTVLEHYLQKAGISTDSI